MVRLSLFALLLLALTGCRTLAPVEEAPAVTSSAELDQLRLENERLRRLLAVEQPAQEECPTPSDTYRGTTVEVLLADVFFESGSPDLKTEGQQRLDDLARRLRTEFQGRRIRIEGHTDGQRIGPSLRSRFPTNWELSSARALTVLRYLIDTHSVDPQRIEAVGMGEFDPVDSNATEQGRARNRRVRVAVL